MKTRQWLSRGEKEEICFQFSFSNSALLLAEDAWIEGIYESPAQNSQIQKSFVHPLVFCTVGCEKSDSKTLRSHWEVLV